MAENIEAAVTTVDGQKPIHIRNILFATDFSSASETALNFALSIARRYESQIYVVHVIRPDSYQMVPPNAVGTTLDLIRRSAEQEMANLLISGRLRGIPHQVLLEEGEVWAVLSDVIRRNEIELLVVGTHGRTGVQKLLLGSVAEQVFRLAQCPVLTAGPKVSEQVPEEQDFHRILFATNFTPASGRAAAYALSLAQEHQAHLTLLHVVQDVDGISPRGIETLREFFTNRLGKLVPPGTELWCDAELQVVFGSVVEGILEAAATQKADLIVLGVRGGGTFLGHLPPAKAYRIVCQAGCPVLTIRG